MIPEVTQNSTRRKKIGGWTAGKRRPDCRWCGGPVLWPRRTFCKAECVNEWRIRTDPGYLRCEVYTRDRGICVKCGVNSVEHSTTPWRAGHLWQADHIIPVVEGGGECDLTNIQTLCTACHKGATAELRKRLALRAKNKKETAA